MFVIKENSFRKANGIPCYGLCRDGGSQIGNYYRTIQEAKEVAQAIYDASEKIVMRLTPINDKLQGYE